jgi:hypothetical protein
MNQQSPATLIIFGAGASAFCTTHSLQSHLTQRIPPLTSDLTKALRERKGDAEISSLLDAIDEYRSENPDTDFESTLRRLYGQFIEDPVMSKQFISLRTELRNLMRGALEIGQAEPTAYTKIFGKFNSSTERAQTKRKLAVINMNYDPLAEYAINNRVEFKDMNDQLGNEARPISLYQPHGASHWACLKNSLGQIEYTRDRNQALPQDFYPALALPMSGDPQNKTCWPEDHKTHLLETLPAVTKICVIGWRGADEHIVDLLSTGLDPRKIDTFHIVGIDHATLERTERLLSRWSSIPIERFTCGFLGYVEDKGSRQMFPCNF